MYLHYLRDVSMSPDPELHTPQFFCLSVGRIRMMMMMMTLHPIPIEDRLQVSVNSGCPVIGIS